MELNKETLLERGYSWFIGRIRKMKDLPPLEMVEFYHNELDDLEKEKFLYTCLKHLKKNDQTLTHQSKEIRRLRSVLNKTIRDKSLFEPNWKLYSKMTNQIEEIDKEKTQLELEMEWIKNLISDKNKSLKSMVDQMVDLRSQHDHELLVNNLLKKQIKELKNEIQIYHNNGQRTNVPTLSEVGYQ